MEPSSSSSSSSRGWNNHVEFHDLFHKIIKLMHHYYYLYPIFLFFILFAFLSLILTLLSFSLYNRFFKTPLPPPQASPPRLVDELPQPDPDIPTRSVLFEALPSDSAKWTNFFGDPDSVSQGPCEEQREKKKKKKKRKAKKNNKGAEEEEEDRGLDSGIRIESVSLYPFTTSSSGSALQRKIKQQYDQLVKSNHSNKLTLAQVVQFADSLIDARNELQHKADVIQRKFVITKALLCKADRSSFDRLHQQIYKLELEQKRLEEDAFVYNLLQHQLKLSPAYQKMLELGACMEKEKQCELLDNRDDEFTDISFEELLAQEKKDSFWQKKGKPRLCSS